MTAFPDIPPARMALLNNAVLTRGSHRRGEGTCAHELLHMVVTGDHADRTPACLTAACEVLPALNDGPWRDDQHRTEVLMPYVRRLMHCARDDETDRRIAFRLADYLCRTIAPEALEAAGLADEAAKLRALAPITDKEAAEVARDAAWTASGVAKDAEWVAQSAWAAARSAAWETALMCARGCARVTGVVAERGAFARHAAAMLDIICESHGA